MKRLRYLLASPGTTSRRTKEGPKKEAENTDAEAANEDDEEFEQELHGDGFGFGGCEVMRRGRSSTVWWKVE